MSRRESEASFELRGKPLRVHASLAGDRLEVRTGEGAPRTGRVASPSPGEVVVRDESGRILRAIVVRGPGADEVSLAIGGRVVRVVRANESSRRGARDRHALDSALEAPMPGTCRDVFVKVGDKVEKGTRLCLIEAMKMEHEIRSPRAGVVKAVRAKKGDPVAPGSPLVEIAES